MKKNVLLIIVFVITCIVGIAIYLTSSNNAIIESGTLYYRNDLDICSYDFSKKEEAKINVKNNNTNEYMPYKDGYISVSYSDNSNTSIISNNIDGYINDISFEGLPHLIGVYQNRLYVLSTGEISNVYLIDLKSGKNDLLLENVSACALAENSLFYIKDNILYLSALDTANEQKICDNAIDIKSSDAALFVKKDDGIFIYNNEIGNLDLFTSKGKYDILAVVDDQNIIVKKQDNNDEISYPLVRFKTHYYLLNISGKKCKLKEFDGKYISNLHYYS